MADGQAPKDKTAGGNGEPDPWGAFPARPTIRRPRTKRHPGTPDSTAENVGGTSPREREDDTEQR